MYFVSDHTGATIYRSTLPEDGELGAPQAVIGGIVGEPTLTEDGRYLYFVHVLHDWVGGFGSDIWCVECKQ